MLRGRYAPVLCSSWACRDMGLKWWGGSSYGKPYVNVTCWMDSLENQVHLKVFPVNGQLVWGVPHFNPPALADCQRSIDNFHLTTSSPPWRRFFWSPWKTPISTWLHSLWNQFSLFCSYSLWVTMDTAPHWFDLSMNLFMSSNLEWKGMFFYLSSSQSKHDLLIGQSMKLHSNAFFSAVQRLQSLSGAIVKTLLPPLLHAASATRGHSEFLQSTQKKKPDNPLNII